MKLPVKYADIPYDQKWMVRNAYAIKQNHKCYHCGAGLKEEPAPEVLARRVNPKYFPEGFFNSPLHLHHDHSTGMTIGVVHAHCNAVLWEHHGE